MSDYCNNDSNNVYSEQLNYIGEVISPQTLTASYQEILGTDNYITTDDIEMALIIALRLEKIKVAGEIIYCHESKLVMRDCIAQIKEAFPHNQTSIRFAQNLQESLETPEDFSTLIGKPMNLFTANLRANEVELFPPNTSQHNSCCTVL